MKRRRGLCLLLVLGVTVWGCVSKPAEISQPEGEPPPEGGSEAMKISSEVFSPGEYIPEKYTCDGEDVSPPLVWSDPPEGVGSFALIMEDPDAPVGTWIHWVLYNIPGQSLSLGEAIHPEAELADGSLHGQNSWKALGYGGPCPPSGAHRYYFRLYALDTVLDLPAGASKKDLLSAVEGHVLAEASLMGLYARTE